MLVLSFALSSCVFIDSPNKDSRSSRVVTDLTNLYIAGACKLDNNTLDLSIIFQGDSRGSGTIRRSNILPDTKLADTFSVVEESLMSQSFSFHTPSIMQSKIDQGEVAEGVAYGESEDGLITGEPTTVELTPSSIEYQWSSSDIEAGRIPLLILLMDQSNSVLGLSRSEHRYGSDIFHQRITFFKSLINNLNDNFEVAILTFSGIASDYGSDSSLVNVPTQNRELLKFSMEELMYSANYQARTPLNQALNDTKSLIEGLDQDTYDPVVVVFTDGVEDGDSSMGAPSIAELTSFYVQRHVPVHTVQLKAKQDTNPASGDLEAETKRPKPLEEMSALACQTGGDFYYIRNAEEFTSNNDLVTMLLNRLSGRWSLKVNTNMFNTIIDDAPGIMLSTELEVVLGDEVERFNAAQTIDSIDNRVKMDSRVWVLNPAQ